MRSRSRSRRRSKSRSRWTATAVLLTTAGLAALFLTTAGLAWSFVHYLIHRDGGKHKKDFCRFLKEMNGSGAKSANRVFKEATRKDLAVIQKGWAAYVLELKAPPLPDWHVLVPKNAATDEDIKRGDLLVSINGYRIDTEADWQSQWGDRDATKPVKLLLLRRFNRKVGMDFEQRFVTVIVKPGSELKLEVNTTIAHMRNLVD